VAARGKALLEALYSASLQLVRSTGDNVRNGKDRGLDEIEDWMRTPQRTSVAFVFGVSGFDTDPGDTCCGLEIITAENVNFY